MSIFKDFEQISIEALNHHCKNSMSEYIGIEFKNIGEDFLMATMPCDHRTVQPMGLINGGAFCTLAETLGSMAANLCLNRKTHVAVGLDINANHIKNINKGYVTGIAKPYHIGKTTQVWEIKIVDEQNNLCCISRLTMAVIAINNGFNENK